MKRRMIYPTVQLKGNGTVGSGILVYSEPQHGIGEEGGSTVHTTLVLTAYHVVLEVMGERAERGMVDEVHVVKDADTSATEVFGAKLVLFDRARDVALLRLNSERRFEKVVDFLPPAELTSVDIFSKAYAVGCPLGNRPLPTLGEVSSKSKIVSDQVFWMLSAPTFFGNSGGGVYLAENCRLIGVSSMIYTYGKTNPTVVPHMGLFVPLETVYRWLDAEGYAFVHQRTPIPQEMLWKLAYVEKSAPVPRAASGPAGH
jgi:S1-C subfamily serine protease